MSPAKVEPSRRYRSERRQSQARQTRDDILAAATRLFRDNGWAGTTLAAIAQEAGVAVETVYSGFSSKKQLLRRVYEASIVGDDEPVPLSERPEYVAMSHGPRATRIKTGARLHTDIQARSARLWRALQEAATSDPEVAQWCAGLERDRREQHRDALQRILGRTVDGKQLDLVWAVLSPEVYLKLTEERRWSAKAYQEWISAAVLALSVASA